MRKRSFGFTLTEILVTLVIIGVLAGIAIPTYQHIMLNVRRTDAQTTLLNMAAQLEAHYGQEQSYLDENGNPPSLKSLGVTNPHRDYQFSMDITRDTYTLYATPLNTQAKNDTRCAVLTVNQLGNKGSQGKNQDNNDCW